jgi:hypothetical protein
MTTDPPEYSLRRGRRGSLFHHGRVIFRIAGEESE